MMDRSAPYNRGEAGSIEGNRAGTKEAAMAYLDVSRIASWHAHVVHPNTGDELRDHRDCALWLGRSHQLNLQAVGG